MTTPSLPILEFVLKNYKNFNSRALRDALVAYHRHVEAGGKMFWAVAGANQLNYLPAPPAPVDQGPSVPAPDATSVFAPGVWVYKTSTFAWRPGYWTAFRPSLVWVPAHYVWTPAGYDAWQRARAQNPDALAADVLAAHPELSSQLVVGTKRGFCLLDFMPAPNFHGTRDPRRFLDCFHNQGIGVGWADEYTSKLDGQWIDVTDVPPGDYVLEVEANASHVFIETNYRDNSTAVRQKVHH